MNLLVSCFICVGYFFDYTTDVTTTILLIEGVIDFNLEEYIISINRVVLTICVFTAYIILLKIFMTYQNQIDEAADKRKKKREKRALKKE